MHRERNSITGKLHGYKQSVEYRNPPLPLLCLAWYSLFLLCTLYYSGDLKSLATAHLGEFGGKNAGLLGRVQGLYYKLYLVQLQYVEGISWSWCWPWIDKVWFWQKGDAPEKNQADAKQNTACWDKTSERPSQFRPISPLKWCHWSGGDVPVFRGRTLPFSRGVIPYNLSRETLRGGSQTSIPPSHISTAPFFSLSFSINPSNNVRLSQPEVLKT